jgi:hypothetical protein
MGYPVEKQSFIEYDWNGILMADEVVHEAEEEECEAVVIVLCPVGIIHGRGRQLRLL